MKFFWYLCSISTVLLILINNPKATSFGNIGDQSQLFSYTKSTQINVQLITIAISLIFLLLTIMLTSHIVI